MLYLKIEVCDPSDTRVLESSLTKSIIKGSGCWFYLRILMDKGASLDMLNLINISELGEYLTWTEVLRNFW